ncbi:hypothetical protein A2V49_03735 [candidate division WWE3 bacterium RBG_19FT_COMBO_34_6]|uniref:ASCH domain-containing protein n=1 Tax=candidate division WWE3 bacterium RBG_19FT_COMBO_34_6 TaxID=1802612 RepID=A0A1F4UL56_UNCKA|nr:MAG: hypothetical protein A2V49_03735 [candidate division WWE3 bacterium RBG_19FT_COMBO_34_6]
MKTLKFSPELVKLIKNGSKTITWRLFDDKNIKKGDKLLFIQRPELIPFAKALVTDVKVKLIKDLNDQDKKGHEEVGSDKDICKTYSKYYKKQITSETQVKVIHFKIV